MQRKRTVVGGSLLAAVAVAGGTLAFENSAHATAKPAVAAAAKPAPAAPVAAKPVAAKPVAKPVAKAQPGTVTVTILGKTITGTPAQVKAIAVAAAKVQGASAASGASPVAESADDQAIDAFVNAGYGYDDAQTLAKMWNTDATGAKVEGGKKIEAGQTLPIPPSTDPSDGVAPADQKAVDDFFNAGYTYDDAVKLGQLWHTDSWSAKIKGGKELEAGQKPPVGP